MINILAVSGVIVCVVILCKALEQSSKEYTIVVSICASILLLSYILVRVSDVLDYVFQLTAIIDDTERIYTVLLKTLGVCIVTNLAVDICKDAGENTLSSVVLMAGKVCILTMTLPLLKEFFYMVKSLIAF